MSCGLLLLYLQQHSYIQAPTTCTSASVSDPGSAEYKKALNHLHKGAEGWVRAEGDNEQLGLRGQLQPGAGTTTDPLPQLILPRPSKAHTLGHQHRPSRARRAVHQADGWR